MNWWYKRPMDLEKAKATPAPTPGRVAFLDGRGELPMLEISTGWSAAEIYLNGAHVTHFARKGEPPLLFLSQCSRFEKGQPIRGGVPVIFPWFGPREGMSQHGFARVKSWEVKELETGADGSVSVRFSLPDCPEASGFPPFNAQYIVTVAESLSLELLIENRSSDQSFHFEDCLHTYFEVGDIDAVSVVGLKGRYYLDKVAGFARKSEEYPEIKVKSEVDRVYLDATEKVEILDRVIGRRIRIEKENSRSTVVWNPWIDKAQQMPDFGNDEYKRMVCVESGNVGKERVELPPGGVSRLTVRLSTSVLA
jgi:glucose-6-phosphate 1-epimerase